MPINQTFDIKLNYKKITLILCGFLLSGLAFSSSPVERDTKITTEVNLLEQDRYAVVATTRKGYGQEYSIGATVETTAYGFKTPTNVVVEGRSVRWNTDYGTPNTYYFHYGSETYYFEFK